MNALDAGGDRRKPGPIIDRILIRAKDIALLGGILWAANKWLVINPIRVQDQVLRQEQIQIQQQKTLEKIVTAVEVQTQALGNIEKRFTEFQRSFYAKKPGGWTFEDDRWKWDQSDKKETR